jgi:hypothetical protein
VTANSPPGDRKQRTAAEVESPEENERRQLFEHKDDSECFVPETAHT